MIANIIIVAIIVVICAIGLKSTIAHSKGEGGCCGGGSDIKVKKKKLANVKETLVISIDGMTCKNCSMRIQNKLNEMDTVSADVNLHKKQAVVEIEDGVSQEDIKSAIERLGYTVTNIDKK